MRVGQPRQGDAFPAVTDDATLGGYLDLHDRPPAFEGSDGAAYSADLYVDDTADADGRYGSAVLFVCWSDSGDRPVGHVETPILAFGATPEAAAAKVRSLSLYEVKEHLDRAIAEKKERLPW